MGLDLSGLRHLPKDKLVHGVGGLAAAVFIALVLAAARYTGLPPVAAAVAVGSFAVAICVEGAQWAANRAAIKAGSTTVHEVSRADALATAAPGLLIVLGLALYGL